MATEDKQAKATPATSVSAALAAALADVTYVRKELMTGLGYTAVTDEAVLAAIRPAMIKHDLAFFPVDMKMVSNETYSTKQGTVMNHIIISATFRIMHGSSGTWLDVQVMGEGADTGDKSLNKAMTGALKYAQRQTFLIETGDDPDRTGSAEQERASSNNSSGQASKPAAGPAPAEQKAAGPVADEAALKAWGELVAKAIAGGVAPNLIPSVDTSKPVSLEGLRLLYGKLDKAIQNKAKNAEKQQAGAKK